MSLHENMIRSKFVSLTVVLLILLLINPTSAYRPRNSFQNWFPDVKAELSSIVANNCSKEPQDYLDERIVQYGVQCVKTFNCIVSYCTEYTKANMAAATVLLGLTPTMLAALGSSTSELSRLSARRPLLAILMVLGSPAVNPIRTFDYHSPTKDLEIEHDELEVREFSPAQDKLFAIFQLLCGLGMVINLGFLCARINFYSVSVMSCDYSDILVEMWIVAALVTHLFGVLTFITRAETNYSGVTSKYRWWKDWYRNEFCTCIKHTNHELIWKRENTAFIVMSYITSVFTVIHLAYGTLQFSSMFFVGTPDTLEIVGRFMVSAVVCRIIVAYELAGQKIAARKYATHRKTKGTENRQETPPNPLSASETRNMSRSNLPRLASPDGDSRTMEPENRSSIDLRLLNEQSTTSIPMAVVAENFQVEERETGALHTLGSASTISKGPPTAEETPLNTRCARTEEV